VLPTGHNLPLAKYMKQPRIVWPDGSRFAFTVFDDPDMQSDGDGALVYDFLADLGFRTTRGVWLLAPTEPAPAVQGHCEQPKHAGWLQGLRERGFEMGMHNATMHTSPREATIRAFEVHRRLFGDGPVTLANHMANADAIYWGCDRLSGWRKLAYNVATRGRNRHRFHGHEEGHRCFWGDICLREVRYVRNFVFRELNTLAACPVMPYHDPARPWVNQWYASSEGGECASFVRTIREAEQERLAEEGGAAIMYAHFGKGFVRDGRLDSRFRELMIRLAKMGGWFVPVRTLLDTIRSQRGEHLLTNRERAAFERKWLLLKLRYGTS